MSLAIKFGDSNDPNQLSGFIYFDAVTKYSKVLSGKVTSHPLDAGVSISDHYISENPKYNIVGVISYADISNLASQIRIDGETPFNANQQGGPIQVGNGGAGLQSFIPRVAQGFLPSTPERVSFDPTVKTDYNEQIVLLIKKLMTGLVYSEQDKKLRNKMTLISLYEFYGKILGIESDNLVMTNCTIDEDADSGSGLFVSISLEQVNFVTLQKTALPKDVAAQLNKSAQGTSKKSKADGTEKKPAEATPSDPGPKLTPREAALKAIEAGQKKVDNLGKKK